MSVISQYIILPLALEWHLTRACNSSCRYCSDNKPEFIEKDLLPTVEKIVGLAPKHIFILGGEPSLVKKLPEIAKKLKETINPHIGISTNLLLPDRITALLPFIDDLVISIDTADKEVNCRYRNADPEIILENISRINAEKLDRGLKVNISVNSVVFSENLKNNGIEKLNDCLYEISPDIWHLFCPLYPADSRWSVINDESAVEKFLNLAERLKKKSRKTAVYYPRLSEGVRSKEPVKCFRRYFRLELKEDGDFYTTCPSADFKYPVCSVPCGNAMFIEKVLLAKKRSELEESPLYGRLTRMETEILKDFVRKYTGNVNIKIFDALNAREKK